MGAKAKENESRTEDGIQDFSQEWLEEKEAGITRPEVVYYYDKDGVRRGIRFNIRIIPAYDRRHIMDKAVTYNEYGEPDLNMEKFNRELVKLALGLDGTSVQKLLENKPMGFWSSLMQSINKVNGNPDGLPGIAKMGDAVDRAKNLDDPEQ